MKKKWLISVGLALAFALLTMPFSGLSTQAKGNDKIMPNQIKLVSGGIGVPLDLANELFPGVYHAPKDGIITGIYGDTPGCVPDVHEFDLGVPGEHIVFTVSYDGSENWSGSFLNQVNDNVTIYAEITSNGQKVMEVPLEVQFEIDQNTGKPFWVVCVFLDSAGLPTGDYNYMFKAKANGNNGHVLDVWVPKNHKFTIVDSSN